MGPSSGDGVDITWGVRQAARQAFDRGERVAGVRPFTTRYWSERCAVIRFWRRFTCWLRRHRPGASEATKAHVGRLYINGMEITGVQHATWNMPDVWLDDDGRLRTGARGTPSTFVVDRDYIEAVNEVVREAFNE